MTKEDSVVECPLKLKEQGNDAFKSGDFDSSLSYYTKALKLIPKDTNDKAVLYKNRAAVYLKQNDFDLSLINI